MNSADHLLTLWAQWIQVHGAIDAPPDWDSTRPPPEALSEPCDFRGDPVMGAVARATANRMQRVAGWVDDAMRVLRRTDRRPIADVLRCKYLGDEIITQAGQSVHGIAYKRRYDGPLYAQIVARRLHVSDDECRYRLRYGRRFVMDYVTDTKRMARGEVGDVRRA